MNTNAVRELSTLREAACAEVGKVHIRRSGVVLEHTITGHIGVGKLKTVAVAKSSVGFAGTHASNKTL